MPMAARTRFGLSRSALTRCAQWALVALLIVACNKPPKKDVVEQNLDLLEAVVRILEAGVSPEETLDALEAFEVETRQRRGALRASIRALGDKRQTKLENDHQDRLYDLTHRIAVAKGELEHRVQRKPELYRRFNRITGRF